MVRLLVAEEVYDPVHLVLCQAVQHHLGKLWRLGQVQPPYIILISLGVGAVQALGGGENVPVLVLRQSFPVVRDIIVQGSLRFGAEVIVLAAGPVHGSPVHIFQQGQPGGGIIPLLDTGHDLLGVVVDLGVSVVPRAEGGEHVVLSIPGEGPVVALIVQHRGQVLAQDFRGGRDVAVAAVPLRLRLGIDKGPDILLPGVDAGSPPTGQDKQPVRCLLEGLIAGEEVARQLRGEQGQQVVLQLRQGVEAIHPEVAAACRVQDFLRGGERAGFKPIPGGPGLLIEGGSLRLGDAGSGLGAAGFRRIFDGAGLRLGVLPAAAEGQHHHGGHDHRHRRQGDLQHPGPVDDEGDPLLHGPFPLAHGGGRPQQPRQRPAGDDHGHQGLAVVQPPVLPQPPDGAVVAGQLAVPAAEHRRPPHQGVVPVQGQAHASDQTPQLVAVAAVGLLVDQDVLQPPGVQGRLIEIDGRAEQPHQAGGGEPLRQVHPGPAGGGQLRRGDAPPPLPQGEVKFQVGQEQDRPHQGCPGVQGPAPEGHGPDAVILAVGDGLLPMLQIHLHAVDGVILAGGLLEPLVRGGPQGEVLFFGVDVVQGPQYREGCHIRSGGLGGGACRRTLGWGIRRGGRDRVIRRQGRLPVGQGPRHRQRGGEEGAGDQQPQDHQQPQGVLEPGVDPPPKAPPQQGQRQDQYR